MNLWQIAIEFLKTKGYAGKDDDLAAAKAFVLKEKLRLKDEGKEIDLDAEHAKAYPPSTDADLSDLTRKAKFDRAVQEEAAKLAAESDDITGKTKARQAGAGTAADIRVLKDRAEDDKKWGYKDLSHFAQDVYHRGPGTNLTKAMEHAATVAKAQGLNQTLMSDGAALVPPEFNTMIWDGMQKGENNLLSQTDGYTVSGESLTFNANAETSRATGSRWGGIRGYWISEAAQITKSAPKLRQVKIEPKEMAILCYATDKLIRNAGPALGQWLTRSASSEINFLTGDSIVNGTGAGQPLGIVPSSGKVSVGKENGQAAATIVKENIDKMWARMHANWRAGAAWFINQDCEPQLDNLNMGVGTGGVPVYLPPGGLSDTPYARLKGRPVVPIEFCATVGTQGDIILANMQAYCSGTTGNGVDAQMSMHLRFDYAETAFRFMFAVDGQPWIASPLTPFKGSNTLSPFVVLDTRS